MSRGKWGHFSLKCHSEQFCIFQPHLPKFSHFIAFLQLYSKKLYLFKELFALAPKNVQFFWWKLPKFWSKGPCRIALSLLLHSISVLEAVNNFFCYKVRTYRKSKPIIANTYCFKGSTGMCNGKSIFQKSNVIFPSILRFVRKI